jgi:hypothetical protein
MAETIQCLQQPLDDKAVSLKRLLRYDDTTAKILVNLQGQDPERTRTGGFTAGAVSMKDDGTSGSS